MRLRIYLNIAIVVLSIFFCLLFIPSKQELFSNGLNLTFTILGLLNIVLFWANCLKITKSWINYESLFLIGFIIVHFQIPFLASMGVEPERPEFVWVNLLVVNYATWLSLVSLLLWILGYLLSSLKRLSKEYKIVDRYYVSVKYIDVALFLLLITFLLTVGNEFLSGSYDGGENWGVGANYVYMLLRVFLMLRIIYSFINYSNHSKKSILYFLSSNKLLFLVLIIYSAIFFFAGDRGPIIEVGIISVLMFSFFYKRLPGVIFFLGVVLGAFFMTIIGLGRSGDSSLRDEGMLAQGYSRITDKESFTIPTAELASSNRILYRAIDSVPDEHPYLYGLTFFQEGIAIFPFASRAFLNLVPVPKMYTSSAYFFTILGQGDNYTFGEGSEVIGDIYVNFGIYGVFILMFSLGYFISFMSFEFVGSKRHIIVIVYVLLAMGAIYLNRSHFLDPLKLIVYAIVIDKLFTRKYISDKLKGI